VQHNAEGDRKANIDLLEATKQANQEEIRRLKDDNKGLRAKLIALHKVGSAWPAGCCCQLAPMRHRHCQLTFRLHCGVNATERKKQ